MTVEKFCYNIYNMKKILCLLLVTLLLIPVGTASLAWNASAADAFMAEVPSNTASVGYSTESTDGATITGKVHVNFTFNNDGVVILKQGENTIQTANIAADGTYTLTNVPEGLFDLLISVSGWTDYNLYDIPVAAGNTYDIYENTIIAGDVNHDNVIDVTDINSTVMQVGSLTTTENIGCDINHDGVVDIADLSNILAESNYGESAYSSYYEMNGYTNPY